MNMKWNELKWITLSTPSFTLNSNDNIQNSTYLLYRQGSIHDL